MGSLIGYFFYEQLSHFDKKSIHDENVKTYFEKDSSLCVSPNFFNDPVAKGKMEASEFNIEIYQGDSLVYWNKESDAVKRNNAIVKRFKSGQFNYQFELDTAKNYITRYGFLDFGFYFLWLCGILFLFSGIYGACINIPNKSKFLIIYLTSLLITWFALSLGGSFIFEYSHHFSRYFEILGLKYYLWQFGFNLIVLTYSLFGFEHKEISAFINRKNAAVRYIIGASLVSIIIYYSIAAVELFVKSKTGIEVKIEEPMNVDYSTLSFYILLIIHASIVIYISKKLFNSAGNQISGWLKSLYFTIPTIGFTLLFNYLGFETNVTGVILFLLIIFLVFDLYFEFFEINTSFLLSSVVVFSIFLSSIIYTNAEIYNKNQILKSINHLTRPLGTEQIYELNGINNEIVNSQLFPTFSNLENFQNVDVKDIKTYISRKIKSNKNLKIDVYCYDSKGNSLAVNQVANKEQIQNIINESEELNSNLFYSPLENIAMLHYTIDNASDATNPIHLSILFNENENEDVLIPYKRDIAIYKNNQLIRVTGINEYYTYPDVLDLNQLDLKHNDIAISRNNFTYVSKSKSNSLVKYLPLLTLFITIFGLLVLFFILLNSMFNFTKQSHSLKFNTKYSLQSRFQTSIISLILFTFILIGGTTAYYYKKLYQSKELQHFTSTLNSITNDIQNDIPAIDDVQNDSRLEKSFSKISKIYTIPLGFYKSTGERILLTKNLSSSPSRLLKSFVEKHATMNGNQLRKIRSINYKPNETLLPVYNSNNNISGYFYLQNQKNNLKYSGLYDFLSTLLTICVFLFLTSLAVSIIISTPLAKSLRNLANSLQNFKLGKANEKLEWSSKDEIGALISNYNQMQVELNQSADLLSKTQREMAWREMAKQVAHEIKNPLTPMKLSIQHLQHASKTDPDKMKTMVDKTANTILDQIENLTQIADEFSSFGTLPKTSNDTFILNDVVEHIHDLFRKREDMDIVMDEILTDIYVFADRTQLVRVLNNIVKNATQSIPENKRGKIKIELNENEHFAVIKVSDNGVGIPENMKDKVFTPNFTTKSSGTGLGLAISANVIESMNGRIYFKSPNEDGGTDFYVELPLVRNSPGEDEVSLE